VSHLIFVFRAPLSHHITSSSQRSEADISTNTGAPELIQVGKLVESTSLSQTNKRLKDWTTSGSGDIRKKGSGSMGIWQKSLFL
jgi:hypothetical protein